MVLARSLGECPERLCISSAAAYLPWLEVGQVDVAGGGVGVVLAQGLEPDRQGAAIHRLGLGVLPLVEEGSGQVVVAGGGVRGGPRPGP